MSKNSSVTKLIGNKIFIGLLIMAVLIVTVSAVLNSRTDKTASNTDNPEKSVQKEVSVVIPENDTLNSPVNEDELMETMLPADEQPPAETVKKDLKFKLPLNGEMQRGFSGNELVWDETMQDWRTHNGVDIASKEGDEVDTSAPGVVTMSVKDEKFGYVVEIDHQNGVTTVYKNLGKTVVKEGDTVDEGQMIGTVGKSAAFESAQKPHLHFEVIEDGKYINPVEFAN